MKKIITKIGTTLLEILIYFGILNIILLVAMTFAIQILNVNRLSANFFELQSNLNFVSDKIVQIVVVAENINQSESIFDNNNGRLALNLSDPDKSPTIFYLQGGNAFMLEGNNSPIQLNSDLITIELFKFHRLVNVKTPDQITLDIQAKPKNSAISNLNKSLNIHLSINLRKI